MKPMEQIKESIMEFFRINGKADGLTEETDLFKGGYVNSLFALQMVMYLEQTFHIKIKNKEITEKNFKTIGSIAQVVERAQKK